MHLLTFKTVVFGYSVGDPWHFGTDPDADPGGPKTNGFGSGCGFITLVHFHHSSKIKSHKEVESKVFLSIFAWWWKEPEPDPYLWLTVRMRIRESQKHMDPTDPDSDADPDPQHCSDLAPLCTGVAPPLPPAAPTPAPPPPCPPAAAPPPAGYYTAPPTRLQQTREEGEFFSFVHNKLFQR